MQTKQTLSRFLALVMVFAMVLSFGVFAVDTEEQAAEPVVILMDQSQEFQLSFTLTEAQAKAVEAAGADAVVWNLTRTAAYANAGEVKPINGETVLFPNEKESIALKELTYGAASRVVTPFTVNADSVKTEVKDSTLTLSFTTSAAVSRGNESLPHSNGGDFLDVCGTFTLNGTAGETVVAEQQNVIVKPYESYHTMWEIYAEITRLAGEGDDDAKTAVPYVTEGSMGTSTAGYNMPYLIVAKDSAVVSNWLALCERAETEPDAVLKELKDGSLGDYQVPILYSNIHSNEIAAVDGILEFAKMLVEQQTIDYTKLTALTEAGEAAVKAQREANGLQLSSLITDVTGFLGSIWPTEESMNSGKVENFDSYYESANVTITVDDLLDDVFFILVPEQNVEGRLYNTRTSSNGFDLNRDNSFQVTNETQNMQHLIGMFNPVTHVELHGQVVAFQVEPCDPPHEPNVEYDLLATHLMTGGEAFGAAAVANNDSYQSYVIPERDYLETDDNGDPWWADPWDDMSTSYTPQFAMLQGCVAYTVELPAYSDDARTAATFGMVGLSDYVRAEKDAYFGDQLKIYARGVNNTNSDAEVGPWLTDEHDNIGAEAKLFRPAYDGEGENGQFFPEAYIIPLDSANQVNLEAAYDMVEWLTRNDVKVGVTNAAVTVNGVTYPAGSAVVSMYQAKRGVANGALYDGTLIQNWTTLYSEGITAFNYTRGFDEVIVTKPAEYKTLAAAVGTTLDYDAAQKWLGENAKSQFTGKTGDDVIISNASEASTSAVNALLKDGKTVGMVTEGQYKGDFIVSYADWQTVSAQYVLTGTGVVGADVTAYVLEKSPVVYISGTVAANTPNAAGYVYTTRVGSYAWNYDRWAMDLMNFTTTADASKADAVVGATGLDESGLAAVQAGAPYVGYSNSAVSAVQKNLLAGVKTASTKGMDCLGTVTYPTETLTNASYIADNDNMFYGYGTTYFTELPEAAKALVQRDGSEPLEGFLNGDKESYEAFLKGIQAFSYVGADDNGNNVDVTLFANTLTNKAHQRDEYAFISNTLFASVLTDEAYAEPAETETGFVDVDANAYYAEAVDWAVANKVTNGMDETHFAPNGSCTRAQAVTFLYRAAGEPSVEGVDNPFSDVPANTWYTNAVLWAVKNNITTGMTATTFEPETTCTRAHIVTFLQRWKDGKASDDAKNPFIDAAEGTWYTDAVLWAVENSITNGMSETTFEPNTTCTRGQIVTFLFRAK